MLKGHLPRVVYHPVYQYTKKHTFLGCSLFSSGETVNVNCEDQVLNWLAWGGGGSKDMN